MGVQEATLFVDWINFVLKSQHKLQFILSKYWTIWWNQAKSRHLVKVAANGENHGNPGFRDSGIFYCPYSYPTCIQHPV